MLGKNAYCVLASNGRILEEPIGNGVKRLLKVSQFLDASLLSTLRSGILQSFAELLESLRTSPQEDNEEQHSQLSAAAIRQKKMFTAQYASENIVRCAEALQVIATELRKHLLVHDHAKNIEETEKRTQELSELRTEMSETLSTFQHELSSHLRSMEEALYLSNEPDTFNE
eukprot:m.48406 g.48406  ORF g.48406 m.48406 type:complete len:171 (-) comp10566_c0_seq3:134-646(-)